MRHALLSSAIPTGPRGVACAPAVARLIAPAGGALRLPSGVLRASSSTVDLAPVAAPTDQNLCAAATTQKKSDRCSIWAFNRGRARTNPASMLSEHLCRISPNIIASSKTRVAFSASCTTCGLPDGIHKQRVGSSGPSWWPPSSQAVGRRIDGFPTPQGPALQEEGNRSRPMATLV
jgi:hypothetical protein